MNILITGNMGYVGSALVHHLRRTIPRARLVGYDCGFFAHCLTATPFLPEVLLHKQYFGDIRAFPYSLLEGVDAIVQLAAISNDPMGKRFEDATDQINFNAAASIACQAVNAGVKHFVFASSCSIYGTADAGLRAESSALNPLTAYAKSKVAVERALSMMDLGGMTVTSLRFSTACGMSDRLRLDLVLNDFVAAAIAAGKISVLSDGSPWRPLIDVKDMARAIEWALMRDPKDAGQYLAVNVGAEQSNYQVRTLAEAVVQVMPGVDLSINTESPVDSRSYRVDFSLFKQLAPMHQPQVSLEQSIMELKVGLERMGFNDPNFRLAQFMRLKVLEHLIEDGLLDSNLHWLRCTA